MSFIYGIKSKYERQCADTLSKNILLRPRSVSYAWCILFCMLLASAVSVVKRLTDLNKVLGDAR